MPDQPAAGGGEASVGGFGSRAEASQVVTGLPLRSWLQGHRGLLERACRLMSGSGPESAPWSREAELPPCRSVTC